MARRNSSHYFCYPPPNEMILLFVRACSLTNVNAMNLEGQNIIENAIAARRGVCSVGVAIAARQGGAHEQEKCSAALGCGK